MEKIEHIQEKIYNSLLESGVSKDTAYSITSHIIYEIQSKTFLSHAEYIQKTLEKKFAKKTMFEILQRQSEIFETPFDLRDEMDVATTQGYILDYERSEAYKCFEKVQDLEFDRDYKQKYSRWLKYEFRFLIQQYCNGSKKGRKDLDEAIKHSSRESFILIYLYQLMQSCPEDIDILKTMAKDFQIGTKIGDKIILKLAMRFVPGFNQLVKLMNSLDLILDCKELFGESGIAY